MAIDEHLFLHKFLHKQSGFPKQIELGFAPTSTTFPSTSSTSTTPATQLMKLLETLTPPSEDKVDKAFINGTKSICSLLKEDKIDYGVAKDVLNTFVSLYVESKIDSSFRRYISKKSEGNYLLHLLESEAESR